MLARQWNLAQARYLTLPCLKYMRQVRAACNTFDLFLWFFLSKEHWGRSPKKLEVNCSEVEDHRNI